MNMTKYSFRKNKSEVIYMKTSIIVLIWTVVFVLLGLFNHQKIDEFSISYIDKFQSIEENISSNQWNEASIKLNEYKKSLEKDKNIWYKLINHGYLNEVFESIEILNQGIYLKDKMISLQEVEKIKMVFNNLMEDECYNLNRIF